MQDDADKASVAAPGDVLFEFPPLPLTVASPIERGYLRPDEVPGWITKAIERLQDEGRLQKDLVWARRRAKRLRQWATRGSPAQRHAAAPLAVKLAEDVRSSCAHNGVPLVLHGVLWNWVTDENAAAPLDCVPTSLKTEEWRKHVMIGRMMNPDYWIDPRLDRVDWGYYSPEFDVARYGIVVFDTRRATHKEIRAALAAAGSGPGGPSAHLRGRVRWLAHALLCDLEAGDAPEFLRHAAPWAEIGAAWKRFLADGVVEDTILHALNAYSLSCHGQKLAFATARRHLLALREKLAADARMESDASD